MGQQDINPVSGIVEKRRTESVKIISLLGALGSWVAVVAYLFARLLTSDPHYYTVAAIGAIMAISLSAATFLANRNRISLAIWLSVFATEIIFIAISFTVANLGIILAIILVIIIGNLAFQSLPTRTAVITTITGIAASVATLMVDVLHLNPFPIVPPDWLAEITIIAGGIIILTLGIQLLRYYQFNSIHAQIIVAFITISVVPLWTVAAPQLIVMSSSLQAAANQALSDSATNISKDFDEALTHLKDNNASDAKLPILVKFAQDGTGTSGDILEYFQIMVKRNLNIVSYSLLDKNGKILVDTQTAQVGRDESSSAADTQNAVQNQQSSISDISFDDAVNKHVFYISSPILNGNGNVSGVLRVEINADLFQTEFEEAVQGTDVTAVLIDQDGIILANSSSPENLFKSVAPLNQDRLAALQQKGILSSGTAENLTVGLLDLQKGVDESKQNSSFRAILIPNGGEINVVTQRGLNNKSWKIAVGKPVSSFVEPANIQTSVTILIATIVMLVALVAAETTSNLLSLPLKYLIATAERIRRGELHIPVKLERYDEIGQLSEMLNATTTELKHNLETLENRVKERTADMEAAAENAERRANQLRSISEITRSITSIQNLDDLLPEITQQVSTTLGFYHVGIFLTDQTGQYAILQANSAGGQKMLEKSYRLKVGQTGIVGFVAGSGQPRIALDIGDNATVFDNPDLPDTRSEMTLPLRVGENIIGALDLQSNEASAFDADDITIFSLLANQISIVIQNAKLFAETRAALAEAQAFYRQSATASWREVLRQGTRGYRYLNGSIEAVKAAGEIPNKINGGSASNPEILTIPINIRGKSLGVLNIRQAGRSQSWSSSEIHIYQSIVDRISFALENARLYQDAQRRASKERVISEIATKVSSSVNMDNILQTAVEELGRVLPGSEVVIQFEQEDETGA